MILWLYMYKIYIFFYYIDYCHQDLPPSIINCTFTTASMKLRNEQLLSPSLLRLWRTGADGLQYSSSEDGDCDVGIAVHVGQQPIIMFFALYFVIYS